MRHILDKLKGGDLRSIGKAEEVVQDILQDPALFGEVFKGLLDGDLIVAVDRVSCSQMTRPQEAQFRIMGPVGSKVLLSIVREGMANPLALEVIRTDLNMTSVRRAGG